METVAAILGVFQTIGDAVASGFKAKIAGEEQSTNRLVAQNMHVENVLEQNAEVLYKTNYFKYAIYLILVVALAYLVWKRQNGK